jgi:hypothetical protein
MEKICSQCKTNFTILSGDKEFYNIMEVPEPTLCYTCRMQRRFANRNERYLYHRACDLTGKKIISSFSTDKPFPVYDIDSWWSDDWDPMDYGQDYDFNRPFFEQFFELRNKVPRLALQQQKPMENSDYCNCASKNKNCYLLFSTNYCEDCYYGSWVNHSKDSVDNLVIENCELCYECIDCRDCFKLQYCQNCINCKDSYFLKNCNGCTNCFGCSNLINKQYCIFNEQKTKEEYEAFLKEVDTGSHQIIQKIKEKIDEQLEDRIVKEFEGTNLENCLGNYLKDCKNCHYAFEIQNCEDIRYSACLTDAKMCMDYSHWGGNAERIYESQACGYDLNNLRFCNLCWSGCSNLTYCDHIFSSQNCFGSVGLKKKQYCIFNKQYSKAEYKELVPQIIEHMKNDESGLAVNPTTGRRSGSWGEFFPINQSTYAYNETLAQEQYPLTKEEIEAKGWQYHEIEPKNTYKGPNIELPDNIHHTGSEMTSQILKSKKSQTPYKIIPQEFNFYQRNNVPIPRFTPDERHFERLTKRNPRKLWERNCQKCNTKIKTSYSPNKSEIVYCEQCYQNEVY